MGVITGRSVESLLDVAGAELAAIPHLVIEGMYGAEWWTDGVLHTMPTPECIHDLRRVVPSVVGATVTDPEVWIEDKRLSLVVHTRMATDPREAQLALAGPLADLAAAHGMELHLGKEVLELRLRGTDKATALERLVDRTTRAVVYAGDDVGDVPAFASVRRWRDRTSLPGITIGVVAEAGSPIAGEADWEVRDTAEADQYVARPRPLAHRPDADDSYHPRGTTMTIIVGYRPTPEGESRTGPGDRRGASLRCPPSRHQQRRAAQRVTGTHLLRSAASTPCRSDWGPPASSTRSGSSTSTDDPAEAISPASRPGGRPHRHRPAPAHAGGQAHHRKRRAAGSPRGRLPRPPVKAA